MRCSSSRWRNAPSPVTSATSRSGSAASGVGAAVAVGAGVDDEGGGDDGAEQAMARPTALSASTRSGVARRERGRMPGAYGGVPDSACDLGARLWTTPARTEDSNVCLSRVPGMGWSNPDVPWSELEAALSGRTGSSLSGGAEADGGDSPAWARKRGAYRRTDLP